MKKIIIAAASVALISLGGCASIGTYFANPQNDLQLAEMAFSSALSLYETVCGSNANASFCTPANMQEAVTLEGAVLAAIKIAESVLTPDGKLMVSSDTFSTDVQNVVSAVQKFSDFVHQIQADKAKAMALKAMR